MVRGHFFLLSIAAALLLLLRQVKSSQVKSNQIKSNQIKSSQVKSSQIKSHQSINQSINRFRQSRQFRQVKSIQVNQFKSSQSISPVNQSVPSISPVNQSKSIDSSHSIPSINPVNTIIPIINIIVNQIKSNHHHHHHHRSVKLPHLTSAHHTTPFPPTKISRKEKPK
jgi:hypothetical protein